ncbi:MAG TPA: urate hydroxylase PuuD [Bdellovibrionales bacterium]|nr:urate hydroxylase PuuD [Bdellovibrionales bacterium]
MLDTFMAGNFVGLYFVLRWLHVFFGIIWIGHLYYFNFVQGAFMNETDAGAKSQVMQKLAPRALWWFRFGALWTFITGVIMLSIRAHQDMSAGGAAVFASPYWISILTGGLMATLMFLNVWFIIWPKQKIVIANAVTVAGGGAANPGVPAASARALCASRTNTLFSVPMLFFMLGASHFGFNVDAESSVMGYWIAALIVIFGIEANAIVGKLGPMTTIKGVITSGFVLTAIFVVLNVVLI